jgi:hypothetical protein
MRSVMELVLQCLSCDHTFATFFFLVWDGKPVQRSIDGHGVLGSPKQTPIPQLELRLCYRAGVQTAALSFLLMNARCIHLFHN